MLVLPLLQRPQKWGRQQAQARRTILAFLDAQGIRRFDLLPALEQALADGVKVEEAPGDSWHPNAAIAEIFARQLRQAGLL